MKRFALILAATLTSVANAQTLRIGLAEDPDILDPTMARTFVGRIVFAGLCDKLFDLDEKLNIVPMLATSHEWSADNKSLTLVLALSYGAREEIVAAARSLATDAAAGTIQPEDIDCTLFASRLSTAGIPDPDLLVRTSGELRVSNFLLWQISYSEIVIVKKFWPEFRQGDLFEAVAEYTRRHRRFGAL